MTHPLTDKQLFIEFLSLGRDYCPDNRNGFSYDDMRAAADWQLEEVKRKVEIELRRWRISGSVDNFKINEYEDFFEEVMQELRPQQQEYK